MHSSRTDRNDIDQLTDIFVKSVSAREVFGQIFEVSAKGKSAYDVKITSPSGKKLAYSSVHRWIKILLRKGAIEVARKVKSKKEVSKILYTYTSRGERAYYFAIDYIKKRNKAAERLLESAKNQSTHFAGLGAPDLLKAALELAEKDARAKRL